MHRKHIPKRMCTGCGEMKPKGELVRVVKSAKQEEETNDNKPCVSLDLTGKKPGRGAYVCKKLSCLKMARKSRRFERAFSCRIPDEVYEQMEGEMAVNE